MEENNTYEGPVLMVKVAKMKTSNMIVNLIIALLTLVGSLIVMGWFFVLGISIIEGIYGIRSLFVYIADNLSMANLLGMGILFCLACGIIAAYYEIFTLLLKQIISRCKDVIMIYRYDITVMDDDNKPIGETASLYNYRLLSEEELGNKISKCIVLRTGNSDIKFKIKQQ